MDKLAENIKILREEKGMSQSQLADRLFVTRQAVARWENGNTQPDIETIGKLAEIFDVSVEYLITGKENVKEVVVEKEVVKEVPPDDYDLFKGDVKMRVILFLIFSVIIEALLIAALVMCAKYVFIEDIWKAIIIEVVFIIVLPITDFVLIRKYIKRDFLKRKSKKRDKRQ